MKRFLVFLVLTAMTGSHAIAQGCSQCKLMAEQGVGVDDTTFASNINSGILYLMAFPYIILLILFRKQIIRFLKSFFTQAKSPQ
jgi:Na+/alanine symporter